MPNMIDRRNLKYINDTYKYFKTYCLIHKRDAASLTLAQSIKQGESTKALKKWPKQKIEKGRSRPMIPYMFDCTVQLSNGATYTRRSQLPRLEWRYIIDSRNSIKWNPRDPSVKFEKKSATGKSATFFKKYKLDSQDANNTKEQLSSTIDKKEQEKSKNDLSTKKDEKDISNIKSEPVKSIKSIKSTKSTKSTETLQPESRTLEDDFLDIMDDLFVDSPTTEKKTTNKKKK